VAAADEDDRYAAMDWLLARQARVEKKLATRHLTNGAHALYDVTSRYYEGRTWARARFGYDRDGKKGRPIIVYGLLTDHAGRPVAVETYAGNTADPTTVPDQVRQRRQRFGLTHVVLVGDRGMLTQTQIDTLKRYPGLGWIAALRAPAIRALVEENRIAPSLCEQPPLAEIFSPDYPGERRVVCYTPRLAAERQRKREALLVATEQALQKIARAVARRTKTPLAPGELGTKVGKVLNRYKVGKHFTLTIADNAFTLARKEQAIQREAWLDGLYVIRTSEPPERRSAADAVRSYKNLARVEQAFRCLKGLDLLVRPIRHWDEHRVRAHILVCMLAYYVEWHMRQALAPLLLEDEELEGARWRRAPVAPAQPSSAVQKTKSLRLTSDGLPIHSFQTLLAALGTRCKNFCQSKATPSGVTFTQRTALTPLQQRASQLLGL
jgi:transposase